MKRKCLCCKNRKRIVEANFELDLTDKSNRKLLLLTQDCDPDTQSYSHHLLADGLVGEFVWTGIIAVVGNSTTKIHILDWSDGGRLYTPEQSMCPNSMCGDSGATNG